MRNILVVAAAVILFPTAPALAQTGLEGRVGKLEGELRAVQRKVFPGGAGTYLEPQITAPATPTGPGPGTPASSALADVTQRVTSLEGQMASMTGQIEQTQYRLRQMEEAFAAYRKATDARIGSGAPAPAETSGVSPALPAPAKPVTKPAVVPTAAKDPDRAKLIGALERPATGDAGEDAYLYGYRLWQAKLYPEAQTQLKSVVAQYPKHRRASYAQNLLGRAYLDEGKPSLASIAFYDNYKKMPDGERAPDSLLFLGQSLVKLNKPADACKVYGELTDVYGTKMSAAMQGDVAKARTAAKCK